MLLAAFFVESQPPTRAVTTYFSWPFLASAGAYSFKKTANGYDVKDIGIDSPGALQGLQSIVDLIKEGVMPKGATQTVMDQKMSSGQLAMMITGPWDWPNLRKSGVDFALAPIPGVGGNPVDLSSAFKRPCSIVQPRILIWQRSF
jgi:maltose/maltodextrin transport system substrate-binding protein